MNLKPQDILFLLKLVALEEKSWSFKKQKGVGDN